MTGTASKAFNDTDQKLHLTATLLDALYDMAIESKALGGPEPESTQLMAMIIVAREKAHESMRFHELEWTALRDQ